MIICVDLDSTIFDCSHRLYYVEQTPKDWRSFFAAIPHDKPMEPQINLVKALAACGYEILYLTGRPERTRAETQEQLARNHLPHGKLLMRQECDHSTSAKFKMLTLRAEVGLRNIALMIDDDNRVHAAAAEAQVPIIYPKGA